MNMRREAADMQQEAVNYQAAYVEEQGIGASLRVALNVAEQTASRIRATEEALQAALPVSEQQACKRVQDRLQAQVNRFAAECSAEVREARMEVRSANERRRQEVKSVMPTIHDQRAEGGEASRAAPPAIAAPKICLPGFGVGYDTRTLIGSQLPSTVRRPEPAWAMISEKPMPKRRPEPAAAVAATDVKPQAFSGAPARVASSSPSSGLERYDITNGDSSEESEEEKRTRQRKQVKTLDLGEFPAPHQFRVFLVSLYTLACASSNRSRMRTLRFIKRAETAPDPSVLLRISKQWEPFDSELFSAIMRCASPALKRELLQEQHKAISHAVPMTGQYALWLLIRRFRLQSGRATQIELTQLLDHHYQVDLESYLDGLETILIAMHKPPDEDMLHAIIEPQLRKCTALQPEFVQYDGAYEGDPVRSAAWLLDRARLAVDRRRLQETHQAMTKSHSTVNSPHSLTY